MWKITIHEQRGEFSRVWWLKSSQSIAYGKVESGWLIVNEREKDSEREREREREESREQRVREEWQEENGNGGARLRVLLASACYGGFSLGSPGQ